jgi:protein-tyrosine phosphatase
MNNKENISVLFVCMGNICRSPTGQGVFETLVQSQNLEDRILVDSAGTHAYHVGEQPDARSQQAAFARGIDLSGQRARRVSTEDFERFDYVLAMDKSNYDDLYRMASPVQRKRLYLFMDFAPKWGVKEVPDPYYGGSNGFERVLDMVEAASQGLLEEIVRNKLA